MPIQLFNATSSLLIFFLITGFLLLLIDNADNSSKPILALLKNNDNVVFAWHLACWMIMGMVSHEIFSLLSAGKSLDSIDLRTILLPMLIAPIVFYPTWQLWIASDKTNRILFIMVAFQNGFFWQVIFQKVQPGN